MHLTKINPIKKKRRIVRTFGGLDVRGDAPAGRWARMENMTSDRSPCAAPRPPRGIVSLPGEGTVSGLIRHGNSVAVTRGSGIVWNGQFYDLGLTDGEKSVVAMGADLLVFPDGAVFNTVSHETGTLNDELVLSTGAREGDPENEGLLYVCMCDRDGAEIVFHKSVATPQSPENGDFWYDIGSTPHVMKQYHSDTGTWDVFDICVKCAFDRSFSFPFSVGDTVYVDPYLTHSQGGESVGLRRGLTEVVAFGDKYFAVKGGYSLGLFDGFSVRVERRIPRMDFVTEAGNRLWGCRWGENADGEFVNEIYASALGDFKNFHIFEGVSTDSYAASVGADGPFTGAANFEGTPVFFKEDAMIRVRGSYPSVFRVTSVPCEGVEAGSSRSLAVLGGRLYYKARRGIMRFDGVSPVLISSPLGDGYSEAKGGAAGGKYRVSMRGRDGKLSLFVWDPDRGVWHREDSLPLIGAADAGGTVCLAAAGAETLFTAEGGDGPVRWFVETGPLGEKGSDRTHVFSVSLRIRTEPLARVSLFVSFDGGEFTRVAGFTGSGGGSAFSVPVRLRRCDRYRLRIEGEGTAEIISVSEIVGEGLRRG